MRGRRRLIVLGAGVLAAAIAVAGPVATASRVIDWKGSESFSGSALLPSPERCGAPPENLEVRLTGTGIDTAGGPFAVTASACVNVATLAISDLEATDTYLRTGDQVAIESSDFTLTLDEATCVASNRRPIRFTASGLSGALTGATGNGRYDIALNWLPCSGLNQPAHVWFAGHLSRPG